MTLPNVTSYSPQVRGSRCQSTALVSRDNVREMVLAHPLSVLIHRVLNSLHDPDGMNALPTKRELAKLIAQAQAPACALITPTMLVLLTLNLRMLRYFKELMQSMRQSMAAILQGRRLPSMIKSEFSMDDMMDDNCSLEEMDYGGKKMKRARLTRESNEFMTAWFLAHKGNPYPSAKERVEIAAVTQLSELQVRNWFANMRKRHWKPQNEDKKPRCLLDLVLRRNTK
ncbi:hypothetical protein THRCLA_05239 [Thraustotheca clavata]|uniref:Homeobox domain-containing protein n=1 Tax=Thraustotheca clavata TaxID=74557 RepID=A0A1V9ZWK2_9STRA|nr:hypothetical protein THRCLA_05239 [Thraustotheca clavata]